MKHPIQPIVTDQHGVARFKPNTIVQYLLENGSIDLNHLATKDFPQEDEEQFAQLIGYSLSGFGDLSYVSNETYETAAAMRERGITEEQARIQHLEGIVENLKGWLRSIVPQVFQVHENDLV